MNDQQKFEWLKVEYAEANQSIRQYVQLRYSQLAVFGAGSAASLYAFSNLDYGALEKCLVAAVVTIFSTVFFVCELSAANKWKYFKGRAEEIEREFGGSLFGNWGDASGPSATRAVKAFYCVIIAVWAVCAIVQLWNLAQAAT
jgi:hypothetical protein